MKVLIAYATTEGQTRKIAEKVANQVRELGHVAELVDVDREHQNIDVDDFNAVIIAASVHQHAHQEAIEVFVAACHAALNTKPTMFLSVSLSAAFDEGRREVQDYIAKFIEHTGWTPRALPGEMESSRRKGIAPDQYVGACPDRQTASHFGGTCSSVSLSVAGALRNEGYDYFQQQILEHVVLKNREVDHPERDHEFTDWKALAEAVKAFLKT